MLLKWLFTILAVLWLIQALRPYFKQPDARIHGQPPDVKHPENKHPEDDGEYIDYEEIK